MSLPATDSDFLRAVVACGARHGDEPVCVHRTPLVMTPGEAHRWRRLLPKMFRLLRRVRNRLLADLDRGADSLAARIGTPLDAIEWARIDPGFPDVAPLARLDAYVVDGVPRFLELNAESPAGMAYASVLAPLFARPGLRFLDPLPPVVRTTAALARAWGLRNRRLRVAIVDFAGVATAPEFHIIAAAFRARGHEAVVATPQQTSFDGEHLRVDGEPVDVVMRRFLLRDLRAHPAACQAILDACRERRVCLVNPLRTGLLHNKATFALLHDPAFPLDDDERLLVSRHIPVTHLLDDHVRETVRRPRHDWVLKPVDAHGGQGVVLGWRSSEAEWDRALSRPGTFVAQARVPAPVAPFHDARDGAIHPRVVDTGPFLARGQLAGFLCRLAEGEIANVSAGGASMVPVFETVR